MTTTWAELSELARTTQAHPDVTKRTKRDRRDTAGRTVREGRRNPRREGTRTAIVSHAIREA